MKKKYIEYVVSKNEFHPVSDPVEGQKKLSPGCYKVVVQPMTGQFWFEEFKMNHDSIIELPSSEYDSIVAEMKKFLSSDVRSKYEKLGFLYKRSALLHGLPGTGKTVITNRISKDVIQSGGIVLFVQTPGILHLAYDALNSLQPETLVMVILEELDGIIEEHGESDLLNILDGEVQKQNVMYLATTNFIEKIPARIVRPGRFSSVIEVKFPNTEARRVYFKHKLGDDFSLFQSWVEKTEGLSIDELKEVVQSVYILGKSIENTVTRLKSTRDIENEEKYLKDGSGGFMKSVLGQYKKANKKDNYS